MRVKKTKKQTFNGRIRPRAFPMAEKDELSNSRWRRAGSIRSRGLCGEDSRDLESFLVSIPIDLQRDL